MTENVAFIMVTIILYKLSSALCDSLFEFVCSGKSLALLS